jgi:DNA-binding SARP family transcriptional activator
MTAERGGLRIRLLGPVHAVRDGAGLALGSAHRKAVFAALATNANRCLSREDLVDAVWGDDPPASAMGNIYTYVSTLRRVLEPDRDRWSAGQVLTSGGGSYCLHVEEDAVDACRFEALREDARRRRAAGDTAGELAAIRSALSLWYGEALAAIPGPHAAGQRLRLGELRLATVERHAELLLDLGRSDDVVSELEELIARHPRREHLHGLAMRALARAGRREAALEIYHGLERRLIEESGTEPGAALRRQHAELVEKKAVFVGRDDQLRLLRDAVTDVAVGRGGSIWIDGGPGSGKSALIAQGLRDATRRGCRVGSGVGDELAQRMPLSVLFECFDMTDESLPDGAHAISFVESLRAVAEPIVDPTVAVLETARSLVRTMTAERPLVLVIDDLQWADETSLLVWHALHRLTGELPLLLISAGRTLPANRNLHLLRSVLPSGGTRVVDLPPLGDDEAAAVVRSIRGRALDPQTVAGVVAAAAGNPCYLRHLAATVDEYGTTVPPPVVAAVNEHLGVLADETRHVLRAVAFLGDDCAVTDLAAVTCRPGPDLVRTIEEALTSGLIVRTGPGLRFRHPIVRRVLHDATPTALRVMVHREFAEKLAAVDGGPERVIAQLLAGPVPVDRWVGQWLVAFAATICVRLPDAAVKVLRHATAQPYLEPWAREKLTAHLARLLFRLGLPAEAEAGWVAARTEDADLRAEMRWIIAVLRHRGGAGLTSATFYAQHSGGVSVIH